MRLERKGEIEIENLLVQFHFLQRLSQCRRLLEKEILPASHHDLHHHHRDHHHDHHHQSLCPTGTARWRTWTRSSWQTWTPSATPSTTSRRSRGTLAGEISIHVLILVIAKSVRMSSSVKLQLGLNVQNISTFTSYKAEFCVYLMIVY